MNTIEINEKQIKSFLIKKLSLLEIDKSKHIIKYELSKINLDNFGYNKDGIYYGTGMTVFNVNINAEVDDNKINLMSKDFRHENVNSADKFIFNLINDI